jgi:AraC-like DNA-binding protein
MDVLSEVLQTVRLSGAVFYSVRACDPFVAETPPMESIGHSVMPGSEHVIPFHIMLRGSCWIESLDDSLPAIKLEEGDVVIYPHGHGHVFVTTPGERCPPDLDLYRRPEYHPLPFVLALNDSGPWTTHFVCGYFGCDAAPFNPVLEALPVQVLSQRPSHGNHIEVDLINAAVRESEISRDGGEAILARLSELLFVRVLRRFIEQMPEQSVGLFAGLRDLNISRALLCIHGHPERDWSLADLSKEAGLSRSAFSDRFAACVGRTPMHYLQQWRMQIAASLLRQSRRSLDSIATEVGYQSEAAFIRAFKTCVGTPPGAWRRMAQPSGLGEGVRSAPGPGASLHFAP